MNWETRHNEMLTNGYSGSMKLEEDNIHTDFHKHLKNIIPQNNYNIVMDYGCGSGKSIKFLMDYFQAKQLIGYEITYIMLDYLKKKYPDYEFRIIEKDLKKVDLIYCSFVLQHISDGEVIEILKKFKNALNEGGKGYIVNSISGGQDRGDMFFRGWDEHKRLCNEAGLFCDIKGIIMYDKVKIGVFEIEKQ